MALFVFYEDVDFQAELGTVFGLGDAEQTFFQAFDLFGLPVFSERRFETAEGAEIVAIVNDLFGFSTITRLAEGGLAPVYEFTFATTLVFEDGYDPMQVVATLPAAPVYISYAPGAVIEGFGIREEMIGQGQFFGRGGSDKIELEDYQANGLGAAETSTAAGGGGQDILKAAVQSAVLDGGSGDDVLVLEFGTAEITGGSGDDEFIFDNGFWDVVGSAAQAAAAATGTVTDFGTGADILVFATVDAAKPRGSAPERESFADLFGAGTLDGLGTVVFDGVTLSFADTAEGAVITRSGTDPNGVTFDTTLTLEDVALAEIDRADVFTQSYAAATYEFF